jgi:hypothetical protein
MIRTTQWSFGRACRVSCTLYPCRGQAPSWFPAKGRS